MSVLSGLPQKVNKPTRTFRSVQAKPRPFGINDEPWSGQVDLHLSLGSTLIGVPVEAVAVGVGFALGDGRSVCDRVQLDE